MSLAMLHQVVLASSHSSSDSLDPRLFGLLLFLSGFLFYGAMYLRYRNADKRHHYESETEAKMLDVRAADQQLDVNTGVKNSRMKGANNHDVRGRAGGGGLGDALPGAVNDALRRIPGAPQL